MHLELTPDKSILILPLEIVVSEAFDLSSYHFRTYYVSDKEIAALEELNKC